MFMSCILQTLNESLMFYVEGYGQLFAILFFFNVRVLQLFLLLKIKN